LDDLQDKTSEDLFAIAGFGPEALEEVNRLLEAHNLSRLEGARRDNTESAFSVQQVRALISLMEPLDQNPHIGLLSTRTRRLLLSA
jgi:hypothetical protein